MIGAYVVVDFLVFKYFIHNRKGLIQFILDSNLFYLFQ
jgi:hypothetical protein